MASNNFNYENTETKTQFGGKKMVRRVSIKNGRGYKSVTKYHRGKKTSSIKKPLHKDHIFTISNGIFVPGLFMDCQSREKKGTRKNR